VRPPDGEQLDRDEAVDRVTGVVWQSVERPVDALRVTVTEAEQADAPTRAVRSGRTRRAVRTRPERWPPPPQVLLTAFPAGRIEIAVK